MNDAVLHIIASECCRACEGEQDFEARCRKAMKVVVEGHWMLGGNSKADEDLCFRGAVGGVLLSKETTDEEKEKITHTLKQLRALSSLLSGLPMDLERMAREQEESPPLPLMKWWHETKDKVNGKARTAQP